MFGSASIRSKLITMVMVTTVAALLLAGMALAVFEYASYRSAMTSELATIADIVGANSTAALSFNDLSTAEELLAGLAPQRDIVGACLYDERGRLFASFPRTVERPTCPATPSPDGVMIRGELFVRSNAVLLKDRDTGRERRVGTLHLLATLGSFRRRLHLFGLVLIAVIAASVLAALLISTRLQGRVSRPILQLAGTAKQISDQHDYALRAPHSTADEIGVAVTAFNQMLDRIQDVDRALREAGETSREQAQLLSSILDNMGEGMVACDMTGEFLVWNAAATRLVGQGPAQLDGADLPAHYGLYRDDGETLFDARALPLARALRGEVVIDCEIFIVPPSTMRGHWISASSRPLLGDQGRLRGGIVVFRDVTERKRAEAELRASEERLRQAQKMEAIGQLAGGIAHDFNNLLTAIGGYGMLALEQLPPNEPARGDIEEIQKAGERAATLTRQLLAFSRRQVLAPQPLDLNAVVVGLDKMLRRLIGENIELVSVPAPDLGVVKADPSQVEQIILNLAVNARDAMPLGGKLTIETANEESDDRYAQAFSGLRSAAHVRLTVSDTGVGMDAETQARIFEPFFTTKELGKGTGLGLSTVYGIVQQSGGHMAVHSEVGRGSSFHVYLPRTSEVALAAPRPITHTPLPRGTETILLVEDEQPVRALARDVLTALGYTVLVAANGIEALRAREEHRGPIHLLISDVVMPQMSGPELAKRLTLLIPGLGILFVSGYAPDGIGHEGTLVANASFMQKPFTPDALARKAREILDRRAAHDVVRCEMI